MLFGCIMSEIKFREEGRIKVHTAQNVFEMLFTNRDNQSLVLAEYARVFSALSSCSIIHSFVSTSFFFFNGSFFNKQGKIDIIFSYEHSLHTCIGALRTN